MGSGPPGARGGGEPGSGSRQARRRRTCCGSSACGPWSGRRPGPAS